MKVAVIGLGRIGLPMMATLATNSYINKIIGIDIDRELIEILRKGDKLNLKEPGLAKLIRENRHKMTFMTLNDAVSLAEINYIIITIGIMPAKNCNDWDMKKAIEPLLELVKYLYIKGFFTQRNTLIIRTTLPVGSTRMIIKYLEKSYGLVEGRDYYIAYVPERLAEGNAINEELYVPKLIGCLSEKSCRKTKILFRSFPCRIIMMRPPEKAELAKLIDNLWRNLVFAFANEMAMISDRLGLDVHEIISAVKIDYPRNTGIPLPGPVSGYCLTKDPYFLCPVKSTNQPILSIIARWVNDYLINNHIVDVVVKWLKSRNTIKKVRIVNFGLSYKRDVDDYRNTHATQILDSLTNKIIEIGIGEDEIEIVIHDPYLDRNRYTAKSQILKSFKAVKPRVLVYMQDLEDITKYLDDISSDIANIVILSTNHTMYDRFIREELYKIDKQNTLIVDLYGIFNNNRKVLEKITNANVYILGSGIWKNQL